ncbi:MAG: aminopeptidase P family protein [Candidatus Koribacter versatilis]|uniref:Xaa-Pro aminopeptidase n=1 Tax=Candidatus Korobacter versatilis TaxID=658062 RepID=A0A932A8F6_9BACT|nr:aminopeptidase P family protein [Candidatus Koribacter versatilis]
MRRYAQLSVLILLLATSLAALERQPNTDYRARRQRLAAMTHGGTVLLFAAVEAEGPNAIYGFHQDNNFYYLTGWSEPGAAVLIAPAADASGENKSRPYTEILFLPAHNATQEKWTGPKLGPESANVREVTGFDNVAVLDRMRDEVVRVLPTPRAVVYSGLAAWDEQRPATVPLQWLRRANAFPNYIGFEDAAPLLAKLRMVKDAGELALIQKAVDASVAAHQAAFKAVKPNVTEREISALMQYEFGRRGCERPAYAPIVGSGFYSTVLHYSEDSGAMRAGDVVVMDVGGEYSGYAADITRTLPINGKWSARQREIYDIVYGAQQAAVDAFQSGRSLLGRGVGADSLYQTAYDYINTHGKDKHGQPLGKYFIHGLGHHVGLDVHDPADYSLPLGPGQVFTLEPGIYIPEEKLGVRLEDMFYVDANGKLVMMTSALPRTAADLEKAMAAK